MPGGFISIQDARHGLRNNRPEQPAGYITWNRHLHKSTNKELMARGAQKIRERDIKKTIIYKTK